MAATHSDLDTIIGEDEGRVGRSELGGRHCDGIGGLRLRVDLARMVVEREAFVITVVTRKSSRVCVDAIPPHLALMGPSRLRKGCDWVHSMAEQGPRYLR